MPVSASCHCERTFIFTLSILVKKSDQWRVSPSQCRKLRKIQFGRHLRPSFGESLSCSCCCVWRLPGKRLLPGITLPVSVPSKNEQSTEQFSTCWKNISTCIICASSMSCQSWQLMWAFRQQSSSYRSPVPKRGHICRCQPDTVREPFSLQFQFSPKCRSMKSVSFAMLKAENAGLWQTPQTCVKKIFWLLMLLFEASRNHVSCSSSRQNMQVSASDRCEKTVLFAVYQWRVSPSHCWKLRKLDFGRHLRPCVKNFSWLLMLLCDGFQELRICHESCIYHTSHCLFRFEQEWTEHCTSVAMLEEYKDLYHLC